MSGGQSSGRDTAAYVSVRSAAVDARARLERAAERMMGPDGAPADSRWWFTSTYVRTTQGALDEADAGSFRDPVFILRLVCYFEQLYYDSLRAAAEGRRAEPHWERAFAVAAGIDASRRRRGRLTRGSGRPSMIGAARSVIAASRAHVRFDLPRAMAWAHRGRGSQEAGRGLESSIGDFMAMAAVFDRAAIAANLEIAQRTHLPVQWLPDRIRDWGMRFVFRADLIHERAWAWECAEALVEAGEAEPSPYEEPEPGRLRGDVTVAAGADPFAALESRLRPTMGRLRRVPADHRGRAAALEVAESADAAARVRALQALCHGVTGRADERAIVRVLEASRASGDLVEVVNGVGAWELAANLHGRSLRRLAEILRDSYYAEVQPSIAAALLDRAVRYLTLRWERTLICDLLCARDDAGGLLAGTGRAWPPIARELSRRERERILERHPELARAG